MSGTYLISPDFAVYAMFKYNMIFYGLSIVAAQLFSSVSFILWNDRADSFMMI
jgi:hypothetical protein